MGYKDEMIVLGDLRVLSIWLALLVLLKGGYIDIYVTIEVELQL